MMKLLPLMVPRSLVWCSLLLLVCSHAVIVVSASSATTTPTAPSFWRPRQETSSSSPSSSSWFSFRKTTSNHNELSKNVTATKSLKQQYIPAWKRSLPEPLCSRSTLERILMPFSTSSSDDESPCFVQVYLLGTAHISTDSCHDVRMLLDHVDPDVLFLELCEQRMGMVLATAPSKDISSLQQDKHHSINNLTFWQKVQQLEQDPKQRMSRPAAMATVLLTQVQEEYASSLGVELGGEFRVAYQHYLTRLDQQRQELQQQLPALEDNRRSIHVVLGDRPLFLTLRRGWESLTWWGRTRLLVALAWSSLWPVNPEELKAWMQAILESGETDILTQSIAELNQTFPSLARTILDERNAYMACKLYQTCRCMMVRANHYAARRPNQRQQLDTLQDSNNNMKNKNITIVAIVGAGHVKGMVEWFTNGNGQSPEQVLRELVQTKSGKSKQTWWQRLLSKNGETPPPNDKVDDTFHAEESYLIENVIELQQPEINRLV